MQVEIINHGLRRRSLTMSLEGKLFLAAVVLFVAAIWGGAIYAFLQL